MNPDQDVNCAAGTWANLALIILACAVLGTGCHGSDQSKVGYLERADSQLLAQWKWTGYDLGGNLINTAPGVVTAGSRRFMFYGDANGGLWMNWNDGPWWNAPVSIFVAGSVISTPSAMVDSNGQVRIFTQAPNHDFVMTMVSSNYPNPPSTTGSWDMGGGNLASAPSAVTTGTNYYKVYYLGTNGHLWLASYTGGPYWNAPADLSAIGIAGAPSALFVPSTSTVYVFYRGANGHLWMTYRGLGDTGYAAPADLNASLSGNPSAVLTSLGQKWVFYTSNTGELMHVQRDTSSWSPPYKHRVILSSDPAGGNEAAVYYKGNNGQVWVATPDPALNEIPVQVLRGNTLVAGKTTAIWITADSQFVNNATSVTVQTTGVGGTVSGSFNSAQFQKVPAGPNGPSIVVPVPGSFFATLMNKMPSSYSITIQVYDASGAIIATTLGSSTFNPTQDLRLLVIPLTVAGNSREQGGIDYLNDITPAMARMASIFPIRDGVQPNFNGAQVAGLRWIYGTNCDIYAPNSCYTNQLTTANQGTDKADIVILYRPGDFDPNPINPGPNCTPHIPYADCTVGAIYLGLQAWLSNTAEINMGGGVGYFPGNLMDCTPGLMAQEVGHFFGLENVPNSPDCCDPQDANHSKFGAIQTTLSYSYDLLQLQPYNLANGAQGTLGDVMNNNLGGWTFGIQSNTAGGSVSFGVLSTFDWEYVRQQLTTKSSTGP